MMMAFLRTGRGREILSEQFDAGFGHHSIEGDIPWLRGNFIDLLKAVSDSEAYWRSPLSTMAQVGERPIIVSSPHPKPVTHVVECNQRQQQEVQHPRVGCLAVAAPWFRNSIPVDNQSLIGEVADKSESAAEEWLYGRKVALFPHLPDSVDYLM